MKIITHVLGRNAYVSMLQARVPMYIIFWVGFPVQLKVEEPSFVMLITSVWCCALRTMPKIRGGGCNTPGFDPYELECIM
jgi:hypothetical protein